MPQLKKRQDKGNTPYNLRDCAYLKDFEKKKIVWKIIGSNINFFIDSNNFFYNNAANILTSKSIVLEGLIAFLNSKLYEWYFKRIMFIEVEGGGIQMFNTVMEKISVPRLSPTEQKPFITLVDKILKAKEEGKDSSALEQEIDQLVYNLYNLTTEEIAWIEQHSKRNDKEE